ncbi:hypothetical protein LJC64_02065, partial [Ruminococcaceae bacterium OttesenSCG-928-A11]|nr:hypothetical protein [Ruminococcaceae bacterium OttesenSCG-928-A11]
MFVSKYNKLDILLYFYISFLRGICGTASPLFVPDCRPARNAVCPIILNRGVNPSFLCRSAPAQNRPKARPGRQWRCFVYFIRLF